MKYVFATDDKESISRTTGRAKWFAFYTIENNKVTDIEYIENDHHGHHHDHDHHQHHHEHGHQHGHHHKKMLDTIKQKDALFVTRHLGKHFKQGVLDLGINYEMTDKETMQDYLNSL